MSRWFLGGVLVVSRWCLGGDTIKTTPSTQHHHQHTIYTTSLTLHHLHYIIKKNIINTTPSRQHHQHNTINIIINTTQHYQHRGPGKSARLNTVDAAFAWQVQHLEHLSFILRGRRSTWSTSVSFCVAGAVRGAPPERSTEVRRGLSNYCGRRLRLRGRRSTWSTSVSFSVAGAARGAPPERSAEVRRGLSNYCGRRLRLRGTRSTWSTSVSFCVAGAALGAPPSPFRAASAARGAPQFHFAWQVQHTEHLQRGPRKSGDD